MTELYVSAVAWHTNCLQRQYNDSNGLFVVLLKRGDWAFGLSHCSKSLLLPHSLMSYFNGLTINLTALPFTDVPVL